MRSNEAFVSLLLHAAGHSRQICTCSSTRQNTCGNFGHAAARSYLDLAAARGRKLAANLVRCTQQYTRGRFGHTATRSYLDLAAASEHSRQTWSAARARKRAADFGRAATYSGRTLAVDLVV
ncbi:hypothetical protein PR003_g27821 [Phytophthora rubi]|uniref:Uncharacterized protein n=1 Tax=Phytophthora rubi TaxID=129364 RepID=A0A6A3MD17_9STRA|nr:hypothetical protein PR001_g16656 [Phytophthora rubi]KAE9026093.1 hypothetical protein PR002_g11002 [Phytophthora rubi]KAE9280928.1 hypothetical protein PR003_g27821 [Phytophthora rubi]